VKVVLWTNDRVMMFGADESGADDRITDWPEVLPGLLAQPAGVVENWYLADGGSDFMMEVPREFMEAVVAFDLDGMKRILATDGRKVSHDVLADPDVHRTGG
jgi:hypothetical protein